MNPITLIAITTFGLEAVVNREVQALGFEMCRVSEGKVEFEATLADIPRANLWLRSADRVLLKVGDFHGGHFRRALRADQVAPVGGMDPAGWRFPGDGQSGEIHAGEHSSLPVDREKGGGRATEKSNRRDSRNRPRLTPSRSPCSEISPR